MGDGGGMQGWDTYAAGFETRRKAGSDMATTISSSPHPVSVVWSWASAKSGAAPFSALAKCATLCTTPATKIDAPMWACSTVEVENQWSQVQKQ